MHRSKSSTLLALALMLAGCGGSSRLPFATRGSPSANVRVGYIARADALCRTYNARQEALRRRSGGLASGKLVPFLRAQATIAAALSSDLGKLRPPAGDRVPVARFVRAVRQLSVYSRALANSIAAGHARAARALAAKLSLTRQQETLLGQGYGYRTCASGKSY